MLTNERADLISCLLELIISFSQQCKAMSAPNTYFERSIFFKSRDYFADDYAFIHCGGVDCGSSCAGVLAEITPLNFESIIPYEDLLDRDHYMVGHCDNGNFVSFSEANDFDVLFMWTYYLVNSRRSDGVEDAVNVMLEFMESWSMTHDDIMERVPDVFYGTMLSIFEEIRKREKLSEYLALSKSRIGRYRDEPKDMTPEKRPRNDVPPPVIRGEGKGKGKSRFPVKFPSEEEEDSSFEKILKKDAERFRNLMMEVDEPSESVLKTPEDRKVSVSYTDCLGGRIATVLFEKNGVGAGAGSSVDVSVASMPEVPPPSPMAAPRKDLSKRKRRSELDLLSCMKGFKFGMTPKRRRRTGGRTHPIVVHNAEDSKEFKGLKEGI